MSDSFKKIAVFASGAGTNAENLILYFKESMVARVVVVLTNNAHAGVIERAGRFNIPVVVFNKVQFTEPEQLINELQKMEVDWIVLAGFLLKIPSKFIRTFPNRIVNIHPALLPKFGGKGMYGKHVHESVINSGEPESGITIHLVNEDYDRGKIVFQAKVKVEKTDDAESLARKIHSLEYKHYPEEVEKLILIGK